MWLWGKTHDCVFRNLFGGGVRMGGSRVSPRGAYIPSPIEREAGQNPCTRTRTRLRQRNRAPGSRRRSGEEFSFLFNSLPRSISKQNYGPGGVHRGFLRDTNSVPSGKAPARRVLDRPRIDLLRDGAGRLARAPHLRRRPVHPRRPLKTEASRCPELLVWPY